MVDIHQPGEHRIVLGDSLKHDAADRDAHISVRYNWVPKNAFNGTTGRIKGVDKDLELVLEKGKDRYNYTGWQSMTGDDEFELALFYDHEQSAYVLENLAASLDMNLRSASNIAADQVRRHALLRQPGKYQDDISHNRQSGNHSGEDDDTSPDETNPFDYRNFLKEAKEASEHVPKATGLGTPILGARTPMSGRASPLPPQAGSTPQFAPIEIVSSKRKLDDNPRRRKAVPPPTKARVNRKPQTSNQPRNVSSSQKATALSAEKIVDSSSDSDDSSSPVAVPVTMKKPASGHKRNVSDMSLTSSRNSEAPLSQIGTPVLGQASNDRPFSRDSNVDIDMPDAEDENAKYFQDADSDDGDNTYVTSGQQKDGDVEELILDDGNNVSSPVAVAPTKSLTPPPTKIHQPKPKRRQSSVIKKRKSQTSHKARSPSPPAPGHGMDAEDDEDDDGGLAAELEAALAQEQDSAVGLGIDTQEQGGGDDDDESDVSEEE